MNPDKKKFLNLLKKTDRPFISDILEKIWDLPIYEYADSLWQNTTNTPSMEKELKDAFEKEFLRVGLKMDEVKLFSDRLEKIRVIQTSTHLTASEGPTFLALHYLSLLKMPSQYTYFVGAYSGVPFSNSAWSGCLNYSNRFELEDIISKNYKGFSDLKKSECDRSRDSKERRVSLIPGNMSKQLVFQSKIPEKLVSQIEYLADPIRKLTPFAVKGNNFSTWATQFCSNQLRHIMKGKSILYFDINEVVRNYLIKVLKKKDHPLHDIFFNSKTRKEILRIFTPGIPFFSIGNFYKNKYRQEPVFIKNGGLWSRNYQLELSSEKIIRELEKGILCPGLFLVFTSLCFLNGMVCFGSFNQVQYLSDFKSKWLKIDLLEKELVYSINVNSFTSGLCIDDSDNTISPLDIILGFNWDFNSNIKMGDFIKPLFPRIGIKI